MDYTINTQRICRTMPNPLDPRIMRRTEILQTLRLGDVSQEQFEELTQELGAIAGDLLKNPPEEVEQ